MKMIQSSIALACVLVAVAVDFDPICSCFNGVAKTYVEGSQEGCQEMNEHVCESCNPHYYLGTENDHCHACAVGKYNLVRQFDPSHQKGTYGEAAVYYPLQSGENSSLYSCKVDPDDLSCAAMSYKAEVDGKGGRSSTDKLCSGAKDCEDMCNGKQNCAYISSLNECHLKDTCVRKAKRSCRSASHCRWDMDVGRCFQLALGSVSDADVAYKNNGIADADCNKKSFNGCINDFYCKWHDEKPVPEAPASPLEQCTCMVCGGGSECSTCAKCGEDETCISDEKSKGCYGVSSSGSTAGGCDCATKVWTPKPVLPVAYPKGHNPMARCMLHPCRQFNKYRCGGVARHFWKRADGTNQKVKNATGFLQNKGGGLVSAGSGNGFVIVEGAQVTRCAWNDESHRCDTIQNSWSKDKQGRSAFWKWSTDMVVPQFSHSLHAAPIKTPWVEPTDGGNDVDDDEN